MTLPRALLLGLIGLVPLTAIAQAPAPQPQQPPGKSAEPTLPPIEIIQEPKKQAPAKKVVPQPKAKAPVAAGPSPPAPAAAAPQPPAGPALAPMSPVAGSEIPIAKVPGAVSLITSPDQQRYGSPSITDVLQQRVPGVIVNDTLGNPLANDLQYRGFSASPLNGTPQGLAVYQNGVRVNEIFGDTVNWDLIPTTAVRDIVVMSNNPVFGLNALGGSVNVIMKDGFNFQGFEVDARVGSFGRRIATAEGGARYGNMAAYAAGEIIDEKGWRDLSPTKARRLHTDIGAKDAGTELHLSFTSARTHLGVVGPTPIELVEQRRANVFTTPQSFDNRMAMVNLRASTAVTDTLKLSGLAYWRGFRQRRPDGNISDIAPCDLAGPNAGLLCVAEGGVEEPIEDTAGNEVLASVLGGGLSGSNDRTSVDARGIGGSLQAVSKAKLFGLGNQFLIGTSIDHGRANVASSSELGILDPTTLVVRGLGIILGGDEFAPVGLEVRTNYYGLYFSDTLDLTPRLALTVGGRYNIAQIKLEDQLGDDLNGSHRFSRFNPMVGASYKLLPGVSVYGGYSEANRAPTPAELACADPQRPCLLENFLVSDPPLKQVVSHTLEAGLKGDFGVGYDARTQRAASRLGWSLGVFRTLNTDDIISVASQTQGRGFFLNAGETLRQGVEASINFRSDHVMIYAGYAFVDATFRNALELSSPDNPAADAEGVIRVAPGDRLPSIPRHRLKAGFDVFVSPEWKLGADLILASSQFFRGDEGNDNPQLPGYAVVNLRTSYQLTKSVQVYGIVENLFNTEYATFGTFFDTGPLDEARGLKDPRTITPAPPFAAFAGVKVKY